MVNIRVELMNKKSAFTLAETIMTLFIVGLVVTAAIPVFTQKQDIIASEVNAPWYNCVDEGGIKQGLCGIRYTNSETNLAPANIVIGGGNPSPGYDLTINYMNPNYTFNDIFMSDKRNFKLKDYIFKEDTTNLYISYMGVSPTTAANSVVIGNASPAKLNNSVILGTTNDKIEYENDVIIGPYNEYRGKNNVIIGQSIQSVSNQDANVKIGVSDNKFLGLSFSETKFEITDTDGENIISGNNTSGVTFYGSLSLKGSLTSSAEISSDRRLKNIKGEYKKGLSEILKIQPVVYRYKGSKTLQTGVIAQDIIDVFPEAVVKMPNGYLGVNTDPVFFATLNALKEVGEKTNAEEQKQIALQKEIAELKNEIETLTSCKNTDFWGKIRCFFYDIKLFAKSLISKLNSEVKYEKV